MEVFLTQAVNFFNNFHPLAQLSHDAQVHIVAERYVPRTDWAASLFPAHAPAVNPDAQEVNGHIDYAVVNPDNSLIYLAIEVKAYNHRELYDGRGRRQAAMEAAAAIAINNQVVHEQLQNEDVPFILTDGRVFIFYTMHVGAAGLEVRHHGSYDALVNHRQRRTILYRVAGLLANASGRIA